MIAMRFVAHGLVTVLHYVRNQGRLCPREVTEPQERTHEQCVLVYGGIKLAGAIRQGGHQDFEVPRTLAETYKERVAATKALAEEHALQSV